MSIKSYDELNPEQRFAYQAGKLAASQQIAEQQARISDLEAQLEIMDRANDTSMQIADDLAGDLEKAQAQLQRQEEALREAAAWMREECRPEAGWVVQGHNWSMSADDRARGCMILAHADAALSKPGAGE